MSLSFANTRSVSILSYASVTKIETEFYCLEKRVDQPPIQGNFGIIIDLFPPAKLSALLPTQLFCPPSPAKHYKGWSNPYPTTKGVIKSDLFHEKTFVLVTANRSFPSSSCK